MSETSHGSSVLLSEEERRTKLHRQLKYYFSDKNLWKDKWLVQQLGGDDATGWLPVKVLLTFDKIQRLTSTKETEEDKNLVLSVLNEIAEVEVEDDRVRRVSPLPPVPAGFAQRQSKAQTPSVNGEKEKHTERSKALEAPPEIHAFRKVPETGVIYVTNRAVEAGFSPDSDKWANLGQGSPETTEIDHWPKNVRKSVAELEEKGFVYTNVERIESIPVTENNSHYGPVNGDWELRCAVANYYNQMFRKGKPSQYTGHNVAIVGGGRLALTRLCSAMGSINLGHFLPDYTAYEELLSVFKNITAIPITLDPDNNFKCTLKDLKKEIIGRGLSSILLSNPCNPTGQLYEGEELKQWVRIARETHCSMIMDEIYSRYIYSQKMAPGDAHWRIVSASQFVKEVDTDPVIILDGFTKTFRLPGIRCCWILGPRAVIQAVEAAGSFLDGGAALPSQKALIPLLEPRRVINDTILLQVLFAHKRSYVLTRLQEIGFEIDHAPAGTFYIWCSVSRFPPPINSGIVFFREAIKECVTVIPGQFFDVNPGHRRPQGGRYHDYIRISYGPPFETLVRGLNNLARLVQKFTQKENKLLLSS
mmetsp:Transcript_15935/g.18615  ORF Transcript_15935/g.18615 Transcript_15935/m.18615 type:complete len:589 (-) Transcript_15935:207-1973(-)